MTMVSVPDGQIGSRREFFTASHFKGALYRVRHFAIDSEASKQGREETVVVYEGLPDRGFFVRPLSMFLETVERDGNVIPRFAEEEEVQQHG